MIFGGSGINGSGQGRRPLSTLALAATLVLTLADPTRAQLFSDQPPPVPPASVPEVPSGPAMNLAPPSGPASAPSLPAPLTQPSVAAAPPVMAPQGAAVPGQG